MNTKAKNRDRVADRALSAAVETVQGLTCPDCGGGLHIQYTDLKNPARRKGRALSVMCERCGWRVISDGLKQEPPWVQKLGRKITTGEPARA